MAGISYEIGAGVSIDANYRYLEVGKARTGFDVYNQKHPHQGHRRQRVPGRPALGLRQRPRPAGLGGLTY